MKAGWLIAMSMLIAPIAHADDDKSGVLASWSHLVDGKVVATETARTVNAASGAFFASGEIKWKTGKKVHKRTHLQRQGERLVRYQRMDGGPKAPGIRIFEWESQLRLAFLNGSGKPVDLGANVPARIWDGDLLHLLATWGLPKNCRSARQPYFDIDAQKSGEATFTCVGTRSATDGNKRPLEVNVFNLSGVPGESIELWVDGQGALIGAKVGTRTMLRAKHTIEGLREAAPADDGAGDEDDTKRAIKERGVGE